jgi:glyoxylase I family protein
LAVEVMGRDHIYVTVNELEGSEGFYDRVMGVLGFRKRRGTIGEDPHVHYAPGLHQFCFRVFDETVVDRAARELAEAGVHATEPRYYPEYAPDYYATFFADPDGIRLEVTNFRETRRKLMYGWDDRADL